MRRRRSRRRTKGSRVEKLLDQVKSGRPGVGKDREADEVRDRRQQRRWQGYRTLDYHRIRELFDSLVALDFDYLLNQNFTASQRVLADLLPQSVVGRAQNGHGWFTDEFGTSLQFPDATFERVLTVLEAADPNLKAHLVRIHGFGRLCVLFGVQR